MTKRKAIIGGVLAIIVACTAWAFGFFDRGIDPAIAELQQLGSQAWDRNLPDAERNQRRDDFRQRLDSLSPDQRRAFFDAGRDQWMVRGQQRMDEYFKMSKADQQKRLDEIINRMVQSQQQNAASNNQQNRNGGGTGNNRGGGRNMTDAQREERAKKRLDRTTPLQRAQFTEFRRQLTDRAQQRGVNLGDQRGRGFGGFGGRG